MARDPRRGRGESSPRFRHHLEDEQDKRPRNDDRRHARYAQLAERHLRLVLEGRLRDPLLAEARLIGAELHGGGNLLMVWVELPPDTDLDAAQASLGRARGLLREELARNLPRRRTPDVRVLAIAAEDGGEGAR